MSNGMMQRGIWRQAQRNSYDNVAASRKLRKRIMRVHSKEVAYNVGDFVSTSYKPKTFYEIVSVNITGTEYGILVKGKLEFILRCDIYYKREEKYVATK